MVTRATPSSTSYSTVGVPETPPSATSGIVVGRRHPSDGSARPGRRPARDDEKPGRSSVAGPWPDPSPPSCRSAWEAPTGWPSRRPSGAVRLSVLGFDVRTVAGEGPVDRLLPGLAMAATDPPTAGEVEAALEDADLVVVENLCSLPLNQPAAAVVAAVIRGRRAVLHHHDLPWQRDQFAGSPPPPDDRCLGARHGERPVPTRAGRRRDRGHGDPQRLRRRRRPR